jgi:hypothetical protein
MLLLTNFNIKYISDLHTTHFSGIMTQVLTLLKTLWDPMRQGINVHDKWRDFACM